MCGGRIMGGGLLTADNGHQWETMSREFCVLFAVSLSHLTFHLVHWDKLNLLSNFLHSPSLPPLCLVFVGVRCRVTVACLVRLCVWLLLLLVDLTVREWWLRDENWSHCDWLPLNFPWLVSTTVEPVLTLTELMAFVLISFHWLLICHIWLRFCNGEYWFHSLFEDWIHLQPRFTKIWLAGINAQTIRRNEFCYACVFLHDLLTLWTDSVNRNTFELVDVFPLSMITVIIDQPSPNH
jgi:hypothetical protein